MPIRVRRTMALQPIHLASVTSAPRKYRRYGFQQYRQILLDRPTANVIGINSHTFLVRRVVAPADLPGTGQTRTCHQVELYIAMIMAEFISWDWPWSNAAHVTDNHIEKLRQLINARLTKQVS